MLGMIRNSLFGSVETWPWQVLSTGGKVGPQSFIEPEDCAAVPTLARAGGGVAKLWVGL